MQKMPHIIDNPFNNVQIELCREQRINTKQQTIFCLNTVQKNSTARAKCHVKFANLLAWV
jgi:hypothetical protein